MKIQNDVSIMHLDTQGGIIESFHLQGSALNPLDFDMEGYRGHFLCAGRWGDPSQAEAARGCVKHGDFRLLPWRMTEALAGYVNMDCHSNKEQLHVSRQLNLHPGKAQFSVEETLTNTAPVAQGFNLVQHPTLGGDFMTSQTLVACNATRGFSYITGPSKELQWPTVTDAGRVHDLRLSLPGSGGVYSFIVDPSQEYGWVTAWSPTHQLLIGYVWKRNDFPWINLWLHEKDNRIIYRGLEFGTTGIHQSVEEIISSGHTNVFGEDTCLTLLPNASRSFTYWCFLQTIPDGFRGVKDVSVNDNDIKLVEHE